MTASILKQDPNTIFFQKNAYVLWHGHNMQIFGEIHYVKPQNDS